MFLGMSSSPQKETRGQGKEVGRGDRSRRQNTVKLFTKMENEPEVERGKINQK